MAGKTPQAALEAFVAPIRRAFDCVTDAVPQPQGAVPDETRALTIVGGEPLRFRDSNMRLTFEQHYQVIRIDDPQRGPWKATTVAYLYDIDDDEGPLLEYHWHPVDYPDPRPHLHVRTDKGKRVRLPAGRVAIEEIIKLLITEYGVPTRRDDWADVLEKGLRDFETWRQWGAAASAAGVR